MRFLDEFRRRPASLADHLPWALLVAPGVVLNKDGAFQATCAFRGPDLESAVPEELMATRARLNNALKRLGSGWCLHVEARRRPAEPTPPGDFPDPVSWLIDEERRAILAADGASFETDFFATFTWAPPFDRTTTLERMMMSDAGSDGAAGGRRQLERFEREVRALVDVFAGALPEARLLSDEETLAYLHAAVSTRSHPVAPSAAFLDATLADEPLTGGVAPRLGEQHLRVVSVRSFPARTTPGLLDALSAMPFACRFVCRWIALDKADAEKELTRLRKQWFAKRKGLGALMREAITKEEAPLVDTDAESKAVECDGALEALGADACGFGYLTLTVTLRDRETRAVDEMARAVLAALNGQGFVARIEDFNAVEAWLGSLPGEVYADPRRPVVSTLNLADLMPASAVWAGPTRNAHLAGPPLLLASTSGATPFRLVTHVGDVGHAMIVGPTGAGKSALLSFMALQFFRYPQAQAIVFDKGRSARAATLCAGGAWASLASDDDGPGIALQPLAGIDRDTERVWAADWIADIAELAGVAVSPRSREEIWATLTAMAGSPPSQRTLTILCSLLQDRAVAAALEPFTLAGPHGRLLDAAETRLAEARLLCFEMEALMAAPSAAPVVLSALFHAIEERFDGRPTMLILDEAWLFLDAPRFAARIRTWLKVLRKRNVAVVFATQSLDDVARSTIASSLIESCPTQIFLPNPRALEPASAAHYAAFGLNRRQLELIAFAPPKRAYYIRQPAGRRLVEITLARAALAVCGASSPEDQALIDATLARVGPVRFPAAFLAAKGLAHVDETLAAFSAHAGAARHAAPVPVVPVPGAPVPAAPVPVAAE
jgi:type IV secretion system protein VirB4